ncbi:MAG TPA: (Fe-S)-binding protein, partial [Anaerolineae bacterium]|nr:(Fe-S)-binding protein [Anaerolineae bacterium]
EMMRATGAGCVVMSCPSCYHTWKNHYPLEGVEVLHTVQFLLRLLEEGRIAPQGEFARRVTYHDPCDLGRKSGLFEEPREILARIPGLTMVEMEAHRADALCCGGGGNLESVDAGLSAAVAARRLAQAKAVGAEVIVTACQQCKRTLMGAVRRERAHIEVLDVVELVWQAMGGGS